MKSCKLFVVLLLTWLFVVPAFAGEENSSLFEGLVPDVDGWNDELHGFVIPAETPEDLRLPEYNIYLEHPDEELPDGVSLVWNINSQDIWYHTEPEPYAYSIPITEWDELTTDQVLSVLMEPAMLRGSWVWENEQIEALLNDYIFCHPEAELLLERKDFFAVSLDRYAAKLNEDEPCAIECLWLIDQIKHGEYSVSKRMQIERAVILAKTSRLAVLDEYCIYDRFVLATGEFEYPFRSVGDQNVNLADSVAPRAIYDPATISLPNGATVPALYDRRPDKTSTKRDADDKKKLEDYPNAFLSAPGTIKYNCHSYAWVRPYTDNKYWINDEYVPQFMTVGSGYTQETWQTAKAGDILWWENGKHSAIILTVINQKNFQVRSKWGDCGVFLHTAGDDPYGGIGNYKIYRRHVEFS